MIYLFDKDEQLIKLIRKDVIKTALQKFELKDGYVSDRLTVEMRMLSDDDLQKVEYMAIQSINDTHDFHYFWIAQKNNTDNITTLVGVQSGIEELQKTVVYDQRPKDQLAKPVIDRLLEGTNWRARFIGGNQTRSTNFYYISTFEALKKVCSVWGLEMQFFVEMNGNKVGARYIDFKERIGKAVGSRVVYGHNALQILQEVERTNIYTALIGRGKGEETENGGFGRKLTFEDVEWTTPVAKPKGQRYVEIPSMTALYGIKNADGTMRPKIGTVDFQDETDANNLLKLTYEQLVNVSRPQVTFKTSTAYISNAEIGDTIRVVRHDKHIDYETRIFEITFNRLNDQSADIKLGDNIKGEAEKRRIQSAINESLDGFVENELKPAFEKLPEFLATADGKNTNWYSDEDPITAYPGKVLINDIWFKPDPEFEGEKIMLRWTGEVWEEILRTSDPDRIKRSIDQQFEDFNTSYDEAKALQDQQIADVLAKAGSAEDLANQAKADAIVEAIRLDTVERQATETKLATAKSQAISEATRLVETAKSLLSGQISNVSTDLSQTKEAIKLLATKATVDTLTGRVSSAESMIQVQADQISQRVKTSDFDQAKQRISTAESSITQLSNRITTEISEVEGKIPTSVVGNNIYAISNNSTIGTNSISGFNQDITTGIISFNTTGSDPYIGRVIIHPTTYIPAMGIKIPVIQGEDISIGLTNSLFTKNYVQYFKNDGNSVKNFKSYPSQKFTVPASELAGVDFITFRYGIGNSTYSIGDKIDTRVKVEYGNANTDWTPATEDLLTEISNAKTIIQTTAEGQTQLSTKVEQQGKTLVSNTADIKTLNDKVALTVTKTTFDNLEKRTTTAETAISTQAGEISKRLTSTQVDKAITDKGYQTKSDVDNNITGRGYITNSALQPYALSTTVQNLVKETADSFSRTISETKALIPTEVGGRNLLLNSSDFVGWSKHDSGATITDSGYNNSKAVVTADASNSGYYANNNKYLPLELNANYVTSCWVFVRKRPKSCYIGFNNVRISNLNDVPLNKWVRVSKVFNTGASTSAYTSNGVFYLIASGGDVLFSAPKLETGIIPTDYTLAIEELTTVTAFNSVKSTVDAHTRTIGDIEGNVSQVTQTAQGLVSRVGSLIDNQNLVYDPTNYSKYARRDANANITRMIMPGYKLIKITQSGLTANAWRGFKMPLHSQRFTQGEKLSYRVVLFVDVVPDDILGFEIKNGGDIIGNFAFQPTQTGGDQIFTGTFTIAKTTLTTDDYSLHVWLRRNGQVNIGQISIVRGDVPPTTFVDSTSAMQLATETQVSQLAGSWAVQNLTNSGTVLNQLNLNKDGSVKIDGKLVQITGTTYIQDGVISSAKIGSLDAGKITTGTLDAARIAVNSIDGSKLVFDQAFVNKMTANEAYLQQIFAKNAFITQVQSVTLSASNVTSGVLRATNGAMDVNLDNANITFNQDATINFNSDSNALVRKKGDVTAFVNFADDSVSGGVYAGFGVTSHAVGVTTASNSDRGKFAGMRVYRPNDRLDLLRLIGDTIELRHGTEGKRFYFKPAQLRNNVDMLKLAGAVYTLSRIFMHLSANGWAFDHPSFISGVKNEMARNWLQDFANGGLPR
ncbi:phage tail spike protein [Streptococcus hyovaginalis]